jgi:TRAP-type uncharacterized transport system substrate-binding protein
MVERELRLELDDLTRPAVHALLAEHLANMHELSPAENVFALDLSKLRSPDVTFWSVWDGERLAGTGPSGVGAGVDIRLHPGAARYYAEAGVAIPAELR